MNFKYDYPRRHAITVEEFMRMGEAHVFGYEARLELIEGEIFDMAPISSAHASVVCRLNTLLREVTQEAIVSVHNPLVVSQRSMTRPDLMLLRYRTDRYYSSHPVAADALLVVEIAATTLGFDLECKRSLYARAGIAELWIVDIDRHKLHVLRKPEPSYSNHFVLASSGGAPVVQLRGLSLAVSALFP